MARYTALSALIASASAAQYVTELSPMDVELLAVELSEWQASEAGAYAAAEGFYDSNMDIMEQMQRLLDTKARIAEVSKLNPEATFSVNSPFSLMTAEEFEAWVDLGYNAENQIFREVEEEQEPLDIEPAMSKDWDGHQCLSSIQNQGRCGSCWAFSTVAVSEFAACLQNGRFTKYSEQQVTSCASGQSGCNGGSTRRAIDWVAQTGLCTAAEVPYRSGSSGSTGSCMSCRKEMLPISGNRKIGSGDSVLMNALNKQVVDVGVCAGNAGWQNYNGGVISYCPDCSRTNHAVVAVGYDSNSFKIKNSWGPSWGDRGYVHFKRDASNSGGTCLVTSRPNIPVMQSGPTPPGPTPRPTPTGTTPRPRPTPTRPSPGGCGSCNNCYYPPTGGCFSGWTERLCNQMGSSFKWCGN